MERKIEELEKTVYGTATDREHGLVGQVQRLNMLQQQAETQTHHRLRATYAVIGSLVTALILAFVR